jgi:hypothetical protein
VYHIVLRVRLEILLSQVLQNSDFDERLMVESLFVPANEKKKNLLLLSASNRSEEERNVRESRTRLTGRYRRPYSLRTSFSRIACTVRIIAGESCSAMTVAHFSHT